MHNEVQVSLCVPCYGYVSILEVLGTYSILVMCLFPVELDTLSYNFLFFCRLIFLLQHPIIFLQKVLKFMVWHSP